MFEQQQLGENVDFVFESGDKKVFVLILILSAHYATILPNFISLLYTGFTNNLSNDNVNTVMNLARELGFLNISVIEEYYHIEQNKHSFRI